MSASWLPLRRRVKGCFVLFSFCAGLAAFPGLAAVAEREVATTTKLSALVLDRPDWCQDTVVVNVRSRWPWPTRDTADIKDLQRLLGRVRPTLEKECPTAKAVRLTGYSSADKVFEGTASKAAGWVLTAGIAETPTAQPTAVVAPSQPPALPSPAPAPAAPPTPAAVAQTTPVPMPAPAPQAAAVPAIPTQTPPENPGAAFVRTCDTLAAHPDDPEAFSSGVDEAKLDTALAIPACQNAVRSDKSPRLAFQLARAYLKADRIEDAIGQLLAAAEQQHGGALAYLGDLSLDGAPGLEADPMLARTLFQKAVASGYEPARKILAEFEDMTETYERAEAEEAKPLANVSVPTRRGQPAKPFAKAEIMENILQRKFDAIPTDEVWSKHYLINVADNIRAICEAHFSPQDIQALQRVAKQDHFALFELDSMRSTSGAMRVLQDFDKSLSAAQERPVDREDPFDSAMADTEALFQRQLCRTQDMDAFSKNLAAYIKNEEAPIAERDHLRPWNSTSILKSCAEAPPLNSSIATRDGCYCFGRALSRASVSQVQRKNLTRSFRPTAIAIARTDANRDLFRGCVEF